MTAPRSTQPSSARTEVDGVPVTGELSAGAQLGHFVIERVGRPWRHGRRLPGQAAATVANGRAEGGVAGVRRRRRVPQPLRARMRDRGLDRALQRDPGLRGRRRSAVCCTSRCATSRGPTCAPCIAAEGRLSPARAARDPVPVGRRARRRARPRTRPPRRQAGERPPRARGRSRAASTSPTSGSPSRRAARGARGRARSSGRSTTPPRNSSRASGSTRARTCTPPAACCTRCSPAGSRSSRSTRRRSSMRT